MSKNLGHARTSITMDVYAHVMPQQHLEVADKVGAVLFGRRAADLARSTWDGFVPGFSFTPEYAIFAIVVGAVIWLLFMLAWFGVARVASMRGRAPGKWAHHRPK